MATVQDLIELWRIKAGGIRESMPGGVPDQIKLLNAAKHRVWQHIIAAGRTNGGNGNWFVKETSTDLSLTTTTRDVDLPLDFHDLVFVEAATPAGWLGVKFEAQDFWKVTFRDSRRTAGTVGPETANGTRYYVVSGDNPARFSLDRFPSETITLNVFYTSILPEWTLTTSNVDRVPTCYFDQIVDLAIMMSYLSRERMEQAAAWKAIWDENKALILGVANTRQRATDVSRQPGDNVG